MSENTPKTKPVPPVQADVNEVSDPVDSPPVEVSTPVTKPAHDPSTIEVEHNPEDPNSPDYVAPLPES